MPSGKQIWIQGFEPNFLDYIFSNKILREEEICYKPHVIYYVDENKKNRRYYPDFYIPKLNLIVEVKSWWILEKQTKVRFECKRAATIKHGYNFCVVMDNNFEEFMEQIKKYESV